MSSVLISILVEGDTAREPILEISEALGIAINGINARTWLTL
jgi:hypothetical protein